MKFHNDISSNFFVYDKNLPSYDFLILEKTPNFFYLPIYFFYGSNLPKTGQVLTLTGTGLIPNREKNWCFFNFQKIIALSIFVVDKKNKKGYKFEGRGGGGSVNRIRRLCQIEI